MRKLTISATLATAFMVAVATLTYSVKPTKKLVATQGAINLDNAVPRQFGDWKIDQSMVAAVVNPQQQAYIDQLYSQTLTRTYINSQGYRIMLTIAYGEDQRDDMQVHKPEVCYPSQGFVLQSIQPGQITSTAGILPVKRILTQLGPRHEPITYWTMIGNEAVKGSLDKKLIEMRYGLRGYIPDGLLFRVSSVDTNDQQAFHIQEKFINELLSATDGPNRKRLSGLN